MSGVRAVGNLAVATRTEVSVSELEDILYDMLATGVDPAAVPGTLDAVQALLHEHARKPKSASELLAFFEAYRIPAAAERGAGHLSAVALPPLALHEASAMSAQHPSSAERSLPGDLATASSLHARFGKWLWLAAACALLAFGALCGVGYTTFQDMRSELTTVRNESAVNAQRLAQVQAQAETLRGGLRDNTALMQRVDKKSDILIRSLLSPLDPKASE